MGRKISSVINVKNDDIVLKVGTMDKKNPTAIYFEYNGYLTPTIESEDNYSEEITSAKKDIKKYIIDSLRIENDILTTSSIFNFDIPEIRIGLNKSTFFTIEVFTKMKEEYVEKGKKDFKSVGNEIGRRYLNRFKDIENIFSDYGFSVSKTSKITIYKKNIEQCKNFS